MRKKKESMQMSGQVIIQVNAQTSSILIQKKITNLESEIYQ